MKSTFRKLVSASIVTIMLVNIILACAVQADNVFVFAENTVSLSPDYSPYIGPTGGKFIARPQTPLPADISIVEVNQQNIRTMDWFQTEKYYVLICDIDLSGAVWEPIGTASNPFAGIFDGQGFVIRNMCISGNLNYGGLFGVVSGAVIKNTGLEGTNIEISGRNNMYAGGICGSASNTYIDNCYNLGSISVSNGNTGSTGRDCYSGGICGYSSANTKILNSYNTGIITSFAQYYPNAGGICGYARNTNFVNNHNTGDVSSIPLSNQQISDARSIAGGICGAAVSSSFSKCSNMGIINSSAHSNIPTVEHHTKSGGICGSASNTTISACYNEGEIKASATRSTSAYSGGICGTTSYSTEISTSYNKGNVTARAVDYANSYAGGICGSFEESLINNCYNMGDVSSTSSYLNGNTRVGGIFGTASSSIINNCFNVGGISASGYSHSVGAICGSVFSLYANPTYINDSYWNIGNPQTKNGVNQDPPLGVGFSSSTIGGLSTKAMSYKSSYENWDFDKIWYLPDELEGIEYIYPELRSMLPPNLEEAELLAFFLEINAHAIVVIDSETLSPIRSFTIETRGNRYPVSDDNGLIKITDFSNNAVVVKVSADGYRENIQYYSIHPRGSRMVFLERDVNDGNPYFTLVADTDTEIDLRSQSRRFTEGDEIIFNLLVAGQWGDHPAGRYVLFQDSVQNGPTGKYIEAITHPVEGIPNAAMLSFPPGLTLNHGYPVKLKMVSSTGIESKPIITNLIISSKNPVSQQYNNNYDVRNVREMDLFGIALTNTKGEEFARLFPLDFSIGANIPGTGGKVPVQVETVQDSDGYRIRGTIGFKNGLPTRDDEFNDLMKQISDAQSPEQRERILNNYKDYTAPTKFHGARVFEYRVLGFFEIKLDDKGNVVHRVGGIIAKLEAGYTWGQTFPMGPIPAYYELKITVDSEFRGELGFYLKDDVEHFGLASEIKVVIPKVTVGGGIGIRGVATVGIEGDAGLQITTGGHWIPSRNEIEPVFKGELTASGAVKVKVLFVVDFKWTFAKLNPPLKLWDINDSNQVTTNAMARYSGVSEDLSYDISFVSRDYTEKTTAWNGNIYSTNPRLRGFDVEQDAMHYLQEWILPNTIPQIAKVGDSLVMLFQFDDKSRALGDNTILMYSTFNNGVWSEPLPIWESDTGDAFFNHIVVNDELYVVWQKQNAKVTQTEDALELLYEVSENSEIAFAKFNKAIGTFENQVFITNNNVLDMYPTVAVNGEEISVVWVSNSDSDALGISGTYSIMKSVYDGEAFSVPVTLYETEEFIAELSAGYVKGKLEVAFTAGDSADLTAAYIVDATGASRSTGEGSVSALKFNNEHFYYHTMGSVYTYNPTTRIAQRIDIPDVFAVSSSYKIVDTDNKQALVWSSFNGDNYSIQASLQLDNGAWTLPITLLTVDDELIIQYMDVAVSDSGTWNVILNTASRDTFNVDEESELSLIDRDVTQKSSLVFAIITQKTDTELNYVYANQRDAVGGIQPVSFYVKNLGETVVESLRVDISSEDKSYFSQVISCYVEPGDAKDFTVNIDVTDLNRVTDLTVFVASVDELDTKNNVKVIQLGQVDVSIVDLTQYKIGDNVIVTVQIANKAKTPANNVVVKVVEDSLDGNVLDVKTIEVLDNTQDCVCIFKIDTSELVYDEFDRKVLFFQVETAEPNYHAYDNTEVIILYKDVEYEISDVPLIQIILVSVESVEVEQDLIELNLDDPDNNSAQLVAKVLPLDATNHGVRWVVEDGDVVLVDSFGVAHALSVGETIITAVTQDGGFTDTVKVIVTSNQVAQYQLNVIAGNGGKVLTGLSGQYAVGEIVELSAVADEHYVFKQWVSSGGGGFDNAFSANTLFVMPEGDVTVTAVFEAVKTFTVSYNVDGVVTGMYAKFVGNTVTVSSDTPTKAGYAFAGWIYKSVTYHESDTFVMPAEDVVLMAQWEAETVEYMVYYYLAGTMDSLVPSVITFGTMDTLVSETALSVAGYSVDEASKCLKLDASGNEIIFYYTAEPVVYDVHYYLVGTTTTSLVTSKTGSGTMDALVSEEAVSIAGYTVDAVSKSLTLVASGNEIIFYYTPRKDISYVVHYYLQGTTQTLAADGSVTGRTMNETVKVDAVAISGYTVVNPSITATLNATNNVFTFYYTKNPAPSPQPTSTSSPSPKSTQSPSTTTPPDITPPNTTPQVKEDDNGTSASWWTFRNMAIVLVVVTALAILGIVYYYSSRRK